MTFIKIESWTVKEGTKQDHDRVIQKWFSLVRKNHLRFFSEWKSVRYYRFLDSEAKPTGRYLMYYEFFSREGYQTYKEKREKGEIPQEKLEELDLHQLFFIEKIAEKYLEPVEEKIWFDFSSKSKSID